MKKWESLVLGLFILSSCSIDKRVVEAEFVDSLLTQYTLPPFAKAVNDDVHFWSNRMQQEPDNFVAKEKYTVGLVERFQLFSDINDLKKAETILQDLISANHTESAGHMLMLAKIKMLQHQFTSAAKLIEKVRSTGAEKYATAMLQFDTDFEQGNYSNAKVILHSNKYTTDYAYNFRLAKLEHYEGVADSAILHMLKAATLSPRHAYKTAALSNAADLHLHSGNVDDAYALYKESLQNNAADFHSIGKIGWVALVHDKKNEQAIRIFHFLQSKVKSPFPMLQLAYAYELTDLKKSKTYAEKFVQEATLPIYGDMYNKYVIELYAGVLNQPQKAVEIATRELKQRRTPQTFTWLASALSASKEPEEAMEVYKQYISGKPLEGYELYLMGKLMQSAGKNFNAKQFYKEAKKNEFDLSPAMIRHMDEALK